MGQAAEYSGDYGLPGRRWGDELRADARGAAGTDSRRASASGANAGRAATRRATSRRASAGGANARRAATRRGPDHLHGRPHGCAGWRMCEFAVDRAGGLRSADESPAGPSFGPDASVPAGDDQLYPGRGPGRSNGATSGSDRGRRRARAAADIGWARPAADTTWARPGAYNGTREWMCRRADIHVLHGLFERN